VLFLKQKRQRGKLPRGLQQQHQKRFGMEELARHQNLPLAVLSLKQGEIP